VLQWPLGRWIVAAVGLGVLAAGLFNLYRALTRKFRKDLREHEMGSQVRSWAIAVGVVGHAARGVVFALVGALLLKAALEYDPTEAIGIDGALRKLAQQPYGPWLLGGVAAGLLAYALFCFVQARFREV
jgi:formate hydrogenlyase subunit 3/multisubunit Na+/H+ antiporter MnhD subunit